MMPMWTWCSADYVNTCIWELVFILAITVRPPSSCWPCSMNPALPLTGRESPRWNGPADTWTQHGPCSGERGLLLIVTPTQHGGFQQTSCMPLRGKKPLFSFVLVYLWVFSFSSPSLIRPSISGEREKKKQNTKPGSRSALVAKSERACVFFFFLSFFLFSSLRWVEPWIALENCFFWIEGRRNDV